MSFFAKLIYIYTRESARNVLDPVKISFLYIIYIIKAIKRELGGGDTTDGSGGGSGGRRPDDRDPEMT